MANKLTIISNAYALLGKGIITDISSSAPTQVQQCVQLYDSFYNAFLASHNYWAFAIRSFVLNQVTIFPVIYGYQYAYQLPSDWIAIFSPDIPGTPYCIIGDLLYTNFENAPTLLYLASVDEGQLPSYYEAFLTWGMARIFAMPVTQQLPLAQWCAQLEQKAKMDAIRTDQNNQPPKQFVSNPIFNSKVNSLPITGVA